MNYAEILKEYIRNSGYKLDEISHMLEKRGLTASREYLSRLQNGKTKPASKELSEALAEITKGNPEKLVLASYIEKAPRELRDFYKGLISKSVEEPQSLAERIMEDNETYESYRSKIFEMVEEEDKDYYLRSTDTPKKLVKLLEKLLPDAKEVLYSKEDDSIVYLLLREGMEKTSVFSKDFEENKVNNLVRIPVLGTIRAGEPIIAMENIEGYTTLPNPGNYSEDDLFLLKVKGDSMIGSRIHDGDKVLVKIQPDVESGDIAVVNVNGYEATLKKVKKMPSGQVLLMPSNDKYEPILIDNEKARIIGKVIQVIFEP